MLKFQEKKEGGAAVLRILKEGPRWRGWEPWVPCVTEGHAQGLGDRE